MNKVIPITVYFDFACPWCYLGKKRMETALKQCGFTASFTYCSYLIDPHVDKNGEDNELYNKRRWGGSGWIEDLKENAKSEGLTFSKWNIWCNSLNAHRVIKYTQKNYPEYTEKVVESIFYEYYENGKNISLISILNEIYTGLGLPNITTMLQSNEMKREVLFDDQAAKRQIGIDGVPFFIINNKFAVEGAQNVSTFVKILTTISKEI